MSHTHPVIHLLVHRLDSERRERDVVRRETMRSTVAGPSRVRRHVMSAWQAVTQRTQTIAPRPESVWDDLGLRPPGR